jgi:hypothetical protein
MFFSEAYYDVVGTVGTIPGDLGDLDKIREILDDMKILVKKNILIFHLPRPIIY